jgi:hypothetical protein
MGSLDMGMVEEKDRNLMIRLGTNPQTFPNKIKLVVWDKVRRPSKGFLFPCSA